jgi:hypothetical protein
VDEVAAVASLLPVVAKQSGSIQGDAFFARFGIICRAISLNGVCARTDRKPDEAFADHIQESIRARTVREQHGLAASELIPIVVSPDALDRCFDAELEFLHR